MNDIGSMIIPIEFALMWYSLFLVARAIFSRYENYRLIWCPELHSFSFIELHPRAPDRSTSVKHCLLWPECKDCKQRCLSSS